MTEQEFRAHITRHATRVIATVDGNAGDALAIAASLIAFGVAVVRRVAPHRAAEVDTLAREIGERMCALADIAPSSAQKAN